MLPDNREAESEERFEELDRYIKENFPGAQLTESFGYRASYKVPRTAVVALSKTFTALERGQLRSFVWLLFGASFLIFPHPWPHFHFSLRFVSLRFSFPRFDSLRSQSLGLPSLRFAYLLYPPTILYRTEDVILWLLRWPQDDIRRRLHNFSDANPFSNSNPRSVFNLTFQFRFLTKCESEAIEIIFFLTVHHHISPYPILPYPPLSSLLSYLILPYPPLSYPALPTLPILFYPVLPFPTPPYPTLPYPTLPYSTQLYPAVSYPLFLYPSIP